MNTKKIFIFFFMLCVLSLSVYARSKAMYVCVKEAKLKSSTGYFAKTLGTLKYADKVKIIEKRGNWAKVSLFAKPSKKGWIPLSSLTRKKLIAKKKGTSASTEELALAGKGLTEGSGNQFKSNDRNYKAVKKVESMQVNAGELESFINKGSLKAGE